MKIPHDPTSHKELEHTQDQNADDMQNRSPRPAQHPLQSPKTITTASHQSPSLHHHHTFDPQAAEFHTRLRSPLQPQDPVQLQSQVRSPFDPSPATASSHMYPYTHRIDTRAMLVNDATGADIEFDFPVYICVMQYNPMSALRGSPSRPWYVPGRSARIMENWRGGGRAQTRSGGHDGASGEWSQSAVRSGTRPWRRGCGVSTGMDRRRGASDASRLHGERNEVDSESEWIQVGHVLDANAHEAVSELINDRT